MFFDHIFGLLLVIFETMLNCTDLECILHHHHYYAHLHHLKHGTHVEEEGKCQFKISNHDRELNMFSFLFEVERTSH